MKVSEVKEKIDRSINALLSNLGPSERKCIGKLEWQSNPHDGTECLFVDFIDFSGKASGRLLFDLEFRYPILDILQVRGTYWFYQLPDEFCEMYGPFSFLDEYWNSSYPTTYDNDNIEQMILDGFSFLLPFIQKDKGKKILKIGKILKEENNILWNGGWDIDNFENFDVDGVIACNSACSCKMGQKAVFMNMDGRLYNPVPEESLLSLKNDKVFLVCMKCINLSVLEVKEKVLIK